MKKIYLQLSFLTAALFLTACTPDIERSLSKEWRALQNYDILETLSLASGFREAFPDNKEKLIRQDRDLCVHEDAYNRQLSANGVSDKVGYHSCTLTITPAPVPSRWDGR